MKKLTAIVLAIVLIAAAGICGYTYYHGEDGAYSRTITQTFTLKENSVTQWKFESDKEIRAHIKIEVVSASLRDKTEAQLLIKGATGASNKSISADELSAHKTVAMSLPFKNGSSNYILFTPVSCKSVQIKVTVTTYSLKGHIKSAGVESGKDYSS